jgi:UvrD/REP helicase N-terminal domain/UvrD-like helicase C-terminal domain
MEPTEEQKAILDAFLNKRESLMIEAMAGCSKTSTIEILVRSERVKSPTAYIVFNKKNQIEAEEKFASARSPWAHLGTASHVSVLTANGLGHRAWGKVLGRRLVLNPKKLPEILKKVLNEEREKNFPGDAFANTLAIVRRARVVGLVPQGGGHNGLVDNSLTSWEEIASSLWLEDVDERCIYFAERTLIQSIARAFLGEIDFDDQIYMSALFGGVFPRFPLLFGDEVQDYSPLNQRQIGLSAADRLILVGDSRQAIYAFRGADASSMTSLQKLRSCWLHLPLSTTFRCPRSVVERQQSHAAGFTAAPSNKEGSFENWYSKEWSIKDLPPDQGIAILCRNNAPLLTAAIRCIKAGRGATVLGSEIGAGLIKLMEKICGKNNLSTKEAGAMVVAWVSIERSKHEFNDEPEKAALVSDKAECLHAVLSETEDTTAAISMLKELFSAENCKITCSTGHKAKGSEWPIVIHLDPWRIPSKQAREQDKAGNPAPLQQELNLKYVIETRSQDRLIIANAKDMK